MPRLFPVLLLASAICPAHTAFALRANRCPEYLDGREHLPAAGAEFEYVFPRGSVTVLELRQ